MRPKLGNFQFGKGLQRLDMFGHQVGVTYKGDSFFKTSVGACASILMFTVTLAYTVLQVGEFVNVANPDVITIEKHINLRETDPKLFSEQQFNIGFEFLYFDGSFSPFEVPENIAKLVATEETEVFYGDGTSTKEWVEIDLVDCQQVYPDLVTEKVLVAGAKSRMLCLDKNVARIQGMEYFNTYSQIQI